MGFSGVEVSEIPFRDCDSQGNGLELLILSLIETHYHLNSGLTWQI